MKILALDTSAEACSVALNLDGDCIGHFQHAPRRHTELLLPMLEQVLAEARLSLRDLDALAFGRGPGSFTGLRIAAGVVQGIALGRDLPVVPVSTLAALALRAFRQQGRRDILCAFDARMGEVYWAGYHCNPEGLPDRVVDERVAHPQQLPPPPQADWYAVGNGWQAHEAALCRQTGVTRKDMDATLVCRAEEIALLAAPLLRNGQGVSAEQALPVYLRDKVAWQKPAPPSV
jgi:tRNA threonylcarbamoyladenosine biosynthesis protein TsaB